VLKLLTAGPDALPAAAPVLLLGVPGCLRGEEEEEEGDKAALTARAWLSRPREGGRWLKLSRSMASARASCIDGVFVFTVDGLFLDFLPAAAEAALTGAAVAAPVIDAA